MNCLAIFNNYSMDGFYLALKVGTVFYLIFSVVEIFVLSLWVLKFFVNVYDDVKTLISSC